MKKQLIFVFSCMALMTAPAYAAVDARAAVPAIAEFPQDPNLENGAKFAKEKGDCKYNSIAGRYASSSLTGSGEASHLRVNGNIVVQ